jgi:hypothetical protein
MSHTAFQSQTQINLLKVNQLPEIKGIREQKIIRCDVVFGSPSLGCRGTGVCKITAHRTVRQDGWRRDCNSTTAFLSPSNGGFGVSMLLMRELLCVNMLRTHLRSGTLELKESCPIPAFFVEGLGLQIKNLRPGHYPIEELDGYYRINFR